jgi:hypothetical protein
VAGGAGQSHEAVEWDNRPRPDLEDTLLASFGFQRVDDRDLASWSCPRCKQEQSRLIKRDSEWVGGLIQEAEGHGRSGEIRIQCDCGQDHAGRPEAGVGCGYEAMVTLEEGPEE